MDNTTVTNFTVEALNLGGLTGQGRQDFRAVQIK